MYTISKDKETEIVIGLFLNTPSARTEKGRQRQMDIGWYPLYTISKGMEIERDGDGYRQVTS